LIRRSTVPVDGAVGAVAAAEDAVVDPAELLAVAESGSTVDVTPAATKRWVVSAAPATDVHKPRPRDSHQAHWYAEDIGVTRLHVPLEALGGSSCALGAADIAAAEPFLLLAVTSTRRVELASVGEVV
jgi:hypothetical protein